MRNTTGTEKKSETEEKEQLSFFEKPKSIEVVKDDTYFPEVIEDWAQLRKLIKGHQVTDENIASGERKGRMSDIGNDVVSQIIALVKEKADKEGLVPCIEDIEISITWADESFGMLPYELTDEEREACETSKRGKKKSQGGED